MGTATKQPLITRLTVELVQEAYRLTDMTPERGSHDRYSCKACALDVVRLAFGAHRILLPYGYSAGLVDGFDGQSRHLIGSPENYSLGLADGRAIAAAVLGNPETNPESTDV